jgi:hypothetical protein
MKELRRDNGRIRYCGVRAVGAERVRVRTKAGYRTRRDEEQVYTCRGGRESSREASAASSYVYGRVVVIVARNRVREVWYDGI